MIIIGSRGLGAVKRLTMGSVSDCTYDMLLSPSAKAHELTGFLFDRLCPQCRVSSSGGQRESSGFNNKSIDVSPSIAVRLSGGAYRS
jgi:hypothetical protein